MAQTFREFIIEADTWENSREHFDLYKEECELSVMAQYINSQQFLAENAETEEVSTLTESYFLESVSDEELDSLYESFGEKFKNFAGKIGNKIGQIFEAIGKFFARIFSACGELIKKIFGGKTPTKEEAAEAVNNMSDEAVEKVAEIISPGSKKPIKVKRKAVINFLAANPQEAVILLGNDRIVDKKKHFVHIDKLADELSAIGMKSAPVSDEDIKRVYKVLIQGEINNLSDYQLTDERVSKLRKAIDKFNEKLKKDNVEFGPGITNMVSELNKVVADMMKTYTEYVEKLRRIEHEKLIYMYQANSNEDHMGSGPDEKGNANKKQKKDNEKRVKQDEKNAAAANEKDAQDLQQKVRMFHGSSY